MPTVKTPAEKLVFHDIRLDAGGKILPWHSSNPAESYDHVIGLVWKFWDTMRTDLNGLPYYMNHQIWKEDVNDFRGIGGDQIPMAINSWLMLYSATGNQRARENAAFMADYYLAHSLSRSDSVWPHIPYPYNTGIYSGVYDGDMILGRGYAQPDKAGSFGSTLIDLFKCTGNHNYLDAAVAIAETLAGNVREGDADNSPLPFKVHAQTGEIGTLRDHDTGRIAGTSCYTTNWTGTMRLLQELIHLDVGSTHTFEEALQTLVSWMVSFPLQTNKWGPFFEDVAGWSDTQRNAVTFARFMMEQPDLFSNWKRNVRAVFDWVYVTLGNRTWEKYGVIAIDEQTSFRYPGNSHTARQAAVELQYARLTGDDAAVEGAVRQLNWATYMVAPDGRNQYPVEAVWMTDGYGDYVQHYLRAMAARPELAPGNVDRILSSTSIISRVEYRDGLYRGPFDWKPMPQLANVRFCYSTYDAGSIEEIRCPTRPTAVFCGTTPLADVGEPRDREGWGWRDLKMGGALTIRHDHERIVTVVGSS